MRRLPHYRLTVRRLMVIVALVGLLMGLGVSAIRLWNQSRIYQQKSYEYAEIELFSDPSHLFVPAVSRGEFSAYRQKSKRTKEWARMLRLKYAHAARNPWITLEPDPPEPK